MQLDLPSFSAAQVGVLEQIATGAPLAVALQEIVTVIEQQAVGMLCSILLLDRAHGRLCHGAAPSLPSEFVAALDGKSIGPAAGSCGTAAYRQECVIVDDIATHPYWRDYRAMALSHGLLACWSTPIVSPEREVLGTFAMYYRERRGPTARERELVSTATHLASIAIVRHRVERELRQSEARSRKLARLYAVSSSVSEALVRIRSTEQLFELACRIAVEKGLAQLAWVGLYRPAVDRFDAVARFGNDAGYVDAIQLNLQDERMNQGPAARAMRSGAVAVSNDIANDPGFYWKEEALSRGLRACSAFPLRLCSRVSGVFVIYGDSPDFFCEEELSVLSVVADDIAFAVDSLENERERQRLFEALSLLHELSNVTRATDNADQVIPLALKLLGNHLHVDGCAYAEVDPDGEHVVVRHEYRNGTLTVMGQHHLSDYGETVANELRRGTNPLVVRDVGADLAHEPLATGKLRALGVQSLVACGLLQRGSLRAIMTVHHNAPRDWTPSEIRIVREVFERGWGALEQRAAETKLRRNETLLRIAGRAARLGGFSIEVPDLRLTWSDEVCAIYEAPPGTVVSLEQAIAFEAPEFRGRTRACILGCTQSGTPFDLELQIITRTGRRVWVRTIGYAERDAALSICRVQGAVQDIDHRRKLEEQLRHSQKMEAVGSLASGVAHDFNNLLSVILSYASFIIEELDEQAPMRSDVLEIRHAGERASQLTRQLLALGRQQILEPRVIALESMMSRMEKMLRRLVGENITLSVHSGPGLGRVLADPGQIEQVVLNLVVNARDAMPRGGTLDVETSNADLDDAEVCDFLGVSPGSYVALTVRDTGEGIDAVTRARIFEPFFTTKDKGKGTGLGLSMVYGIVTQSGGNITVQSEPGAGTTFTAYFPRVHEQLDGTSITSENEGRARRAPAPNGQGQHVLHVDDEEALIHLTARILGRLGYQVTSFADPERALGAFVEKPSTFDAVVSDVTMKGMTGFELIRRLRDVRPEIPVVLMSGDFRPEDIHTATQMNIEHLVVKSDTAEELGPVLHEVLAQAVKR